MSEDLQPKIILKEATLRIPIFSNNNNSIKNKILTSFSGGRISVENKIKNVLIEADRFVDLILFLYKYYLQYFQQLKNNQLIFDGLID